MVDVPIDNLHYWFKRLLRLEIMLPSILSYIIPLLAISMPAAAGVRQSQTPYSGNTTVSSYRNAAYFTNW